jgi:hypothetical protein
MAQWTAGFRLPRLQGIKVLVVNTLPGALIRIWQRMIVEGQTGKWLGYNIRHYGNALRNYVGALIDGKTNKSHRD